jgi:hypothetical protein
VSDVLEVGVTIEADGRMAINAHGQPTVIVERILSAALAGVQRELLALRVVEVVESRAAERNQLSVVRSALGRNHRPGPPTP